MRSRRSTALGCAVSIALGLVCLNLVLPGFAASADQGQEVQQPAASPVTKPVGSVKAISGNVITLTTDGGSTVNVVVQDSTRLVRIAPGQKDLKDATPSSCRTCRWETGSWHEAVLRM